MRSAVYFDLPGGAVGGVPGVWVGTARGASDALPLLVVGAEGVVVGCPVVPEADTRRAALVVGATGAGFVVVVDGAGSFDGFGFWAAVSELPDVGSGRPRLGSDTWVTRLNTTAVTPITRVAEMTRTAHRARTRRRPVSSVKIDVGMACFPRVCAAIPVKHNGAWLKGRA